MVPWRGSVLGVVVSILLLTAAPSTVAEDVIASRARGLLERTVRADGPGAVFLVGRGDSVVYTGTRGQGHIELGVPLQVDHVFRIASITKMFVAASVVKLAESGALSLEEPVAHRLPEMVEARGMTVRQLLNHTAGVSDTALVSERSLTPRAYDRFARLAAIGQRPVDFPPGSRWRYSNAGYIVLGALVERITGTPWYVALDQQFFARLGLRHTGYADAGTLRSGRVAGYTTTAGQVRNVSFISPTIPDAAGGLVSTADDLFRWCRALAAGRVISRESVRQMMAPAAETNGPVRYGLGVYVWTVRGETMIGHTGQIPGFAAMVGYLPAHDVTIVTLGNDDAFDARVVGRRLAAIAIGRPYPDVAPVAVRAEALQALTGQYRIDETTVRTLSLKDGRLYAQRGNGAVLPLQATAEGHLHFDPDELTYFVPVREPSGQVVRLDYYQDGEGPAQPLPRVAAAPPRDPGASRPRVR
jgi:CubicO group peptidase (beta-lactamase class C family)